MKIKKELETFFLILAVIMLGVVSYRVYKTLSLPPKAPAPPAVVIEPPPPPPVVKPMSRVTNILIEKANRTMTLYHNQEVLRTYRVALGFSPVGTKEKQGDGKTPEGKYKINAKNPKSRFHLSLQISYPSQSDKKAAREKGVDPGNAIMIHGLHKGLSWLGAKHALRDWTLGCIAVTNEEIEELYPYVDIGTLVEIKP